MRKQILLFVIFLCACTQIQVRATVQAGELLIINKDTFWIFACPIEMDPVLRREVGKRVVGERYTSCWRGYIGIWRMEANKIYLEKILNSCGARPYTYISTDIIFDKYRDRKGRIPASWFDKEIRVVKGEQLRYIMNSPGIFEDETFYQVKNGVITGKRTYHNTIKVASIDKKQALNIIQKSFNVDLFSELSDKKVIAWIKILPASDGKIDSLSISLSIDNGEYKEYAPDHPYIMELKKGIDLVPDWDVPVLYGKREWENIFPIVSRGKI